MEKEFKVYLGADHAGLRLKNAIKQYLSETKINYVDFGADTLTSDDDYPDFAKKVAQTISRQPKNFGILICGSGHGMCIAANRFKKVRAILGYSVSAVMVGREHNDSNVLCLAGRFLSTTQGVHLVETFLKTDFPGEERHARRIKKIG
ncbi:MAG: RpiB/LacA/LacB family sugar-phosphate isomerase [Patescibacteria group bacterium]